MLVDSKYRAEYKKKYKECWTDSVACHFPSDQMERKATVKATKKREWVQKEITAVLHYKAKMKNSGRPYNFILSTPQYDIEQKFNEFAANWRRETGGYSTTKQITRNSWYIRIIAMGPDVVPFILKDLQKEPDYWFDALDYILNPGVNPVPNNHYGDIEKMAEDWLSWAKQNNYIA